MGVVVVEGVAEALPVVEELLEWDKVEVGVAVSAKEGDRVTEELSVWTGVLDKGTGTQDTEGVEEALGVMMVRVGDGEVLVVAEGTESGVKPRAGGRTQLRGDAVISLQSPT